MLETRHQTQPTDISLLFLLDPRVGLGYTTPAKPLKPEVVFDMARERMTEYPDELKLQEILSEGLPMMVPRAYLYGRQKIIRMKPQREKQLRKNLEKRAR